jgi:hypothetical protein
MMNIKTLSTLCISVFQDDWGLLTSWGTSWNTPFQFCFCSVGSGHCCCFVITHFFGRFLVPKWLRRCELISKLMDYYCAWNFTATFFLTLSIRMACTVHNPLPPHPSKKKLFNRILNHMCTQQKPILDILYGHLSCCKNNCREVCF